MARGKPKSPPSRWELLAGNGLDMVERFKTVTVHKSAAKSGMLEHLPNSFQLLDIQNLLGVDAMTAKSLVCTWRSSDGLTSSRKGRFATYAKVDRSKTNYK